MIAKANQVLSPLMARARRWPFSSVAIAFIFSTLLLGLLVASTRTSGPFLPSPWATDVDVEKATETPLIDRKMHLLMPATQSNVNFCKTLLTLAILGYPKPFIVAWGAEDEEGGLLGGGSHFAKITGVLDYINSEERRKQPGFDDELVFMIDSYDIWFQLPYETLISRYEAIVREENERVAQRMGRAHGLEGISSPVIFGGGKRCSPNQIHTLACYATPESPLPEDIHQGNTDTIMGYNLFSSYRTRFLNSGYMIGPIGEMRPILERANIKLDECINRTDAWWDNGNHETDYCYRGSDQSIFVEMFGEQEFHREVMRRHHRRFYDDWLDKLIPGRAGSKLPPTQIMGAKIDDPLNPAFSHEEREPKYLPNKPFEFGIGIDYWSLLGHQTSNAEFDARYLRYNEPIDPQVGQQGIWDCPPKAAMPQDLSDDSGVLKLLPKGSTWNTIPLYSEICVGTIPVMIHHNNVDKTQLERQWARPWWHGQSRHLLEERRKQGTPMLTEGIQTDSGETMMWEQLCPAGVEPELFRDGPPVGEEEEEEEHD